MACQIHQLIAVSATDIGGSGLSDGGGCHIHLNLRSASHKLNLLAGGHPSNQAARGALQEELLSQTHKDAHNRLGVQFLCDPETESATVRIWRHNDRVHAPLNDNGRLTCGHDHL